MATRKNYKPILTHKKRMRYYLIYLLTLNLLAMGYVGFIH